VLYQSDIVRNKVFSDVVNPDLASGALFAAKFPTVATTATIMHTTGEAALYTDIQAASMYDEHFIAALNAVAQRPNMAKDLVLVQTKNT
jgi:hypothetical protein